MAQADSQSTTRSAFLRSPETSPASDKLTLSPAMPVSVAMGSGPKPPDPILAAIEAHKHALDQRNRMIEGICAAEDRQKAEERDAWHRYEDWRNCNHELRCPARMFRTGGMRDNLGWS
jgi:hypothetical protein